MNRQKELARISQAIMTQQGGSIRPPSGWTWPLPFTVYESGGVFKTRGWSIDANRPTGKAYYVSMTGNDANDGLTPGTALRKIYTAYGKPDADVVYVAAGTYGLTNGLAASATRSVSIIATGGRVKAGPFAEGLTWVKDTVGGFPNTYKAARTFVLKVADATQIDANGDYTFLTTQSSAADVEANPGSWYTDGTSVWVRTIDDRPPYVDIRCHFSNTNNALPFQTAGNTYYLEGFDMEGGINSAGRLYTIGAMNYGYFNNCTFKYSSGNGFSVQGGTAFFKDCLCARNGDDGFNYHVQTANIPCGVEIDCIGRDNGLAGDIDNGSTMHDGGTILRLNGEYMRNVGRNIHDINPGTKSWNLGVYAHDSTSLVNDINFAVGTGSNGGEMWLDKCLSGGSAHDLESDLGATMFTRRLASGLSMIGAGTFADY